MQPTETKHEAHPVAVTIFMAIGQVLVMAIKLLPAAICLGFTLHLHYNWLQGLGLFGIAELVKKLFSLLYEELTAN